MNVAHVGLEVLTTLIMKSTIFWDIKPCSPLKGNRRFGGTYRLHLQSQRKSKWSYQLTCYLLWCLFPPQLLWLWRWKWHVSLKRRLTFSGLHDVIPGKILLFTIAYGWGRLCGQSFWLQIRSSLVRFPIPPDFLRSRGSGTGSAQPRDENWGATWRRSSDSGLENRD
jgi:hypothetical protein